MATPWLSQRLHTPVPAAEPVAMPPHDGLGLHQHHRRARVPSDSGQAVKTVGRGSRNGGVWSCVSLLAENSTVTSSGEDQLT
jgi:hypothetical protein